MESDTADEFFVLLENHIPAAARKSVRPLVAGGCVDRDDDQEVRESTLACRRDIVHRLNNWHRYGCFPTTSTGNATIPFVRRSPNCINLFVDDAQIIRDRALPITPWGILKMVAWEPSERTDPDRF